MSSSSNFLYKYVPGLSTLQTKLNQLTSYIPPPPRLLREDDDSPARKILLIQAHPNDTTSFCAAISDTFEQSASQQQHEVRRIILNGENNYNPVMSRSERLEYFKNAGSTVVVDESHLAPMIQQHLKLLRWCDTLVLVYPTWWSSTPAVLKGFFDRTLVCGSTWDFPSKDHNSPSSIGLVPRLTNIGKIVGISTYGASSLITYMGGDGGRIMISNNIRHSISPQASVTWLGLYNMDQTTVEARREFLDQVGQLANDL